MANQSKTPITYQVRAMEHNLNNLMSKLDEVVSTRAVIESADEQHYALDCPLVLNRLTVNKEMYLTVLKHNEDILKADIATLESKLTTVYAAVNDCLAEGK